MWINTDFYPFVTGPALITGAGTLGRELARQMLDMGMDVHLLDNNENALFGAKEYIGGKHRLFLHLIDLRERQTVERLFDEYTISEVYHTAAMKHVTFSVDNPAECVKTNIMGTMNLLDALRDHTVRFVNVSTDKVCDPCNIYGASKLVVEHLVSHKALQTMKPYYSCRFGNFLGSQGSVLEKWRIQAKKGKISVTDDSMERFFIKPKEVAEFIIKSRGWGRGSEIYVPYTKVIRIGTLARVISDRYGVPTMRIGPYPGEKYHETLVTQDEAFYTFEKDDYLVIDTTKLKRGEKFMSAITTSYMPLLNYDETLEYVEEFLW